MHHAIAEAVVGNRVEGLPQQAFDRISDYVLEHGEYVLRQLERLDDDQADILKMLIKEGFLEQDEKGRLTVAPKGMRRIYGQVLAKLDEAVRT